MICVRSELCAMAQIRGQKGLTMTQNEINSKNIKKTRATITSNERTQQLSDDCEQPQKTSSAKSLKSHHSKPDCNQVK